MQSAVNLAFGGSVLLGSLGARVHWILSHGRTGPQPCMRAEPGMHGMRGATVIEVRVDTPKNNRHYFVILPLCGIDNQRLVMSSRRCVAARKMLCDPKQQSSRLLQRPFVAAKHSLAGRTTN